MHKISININLYKNYLRKKYLLYRKSLSNSKKQIFDNRIFSKLISLNEYKTCEILLTYVSTPIEVDTKKLIEFALKDGKKVAVPKCIDGTHKIDFYFINSLNNLEAAKFSLLEPKTDICEKVVSFDNSICVVPGFAYDNKGYRLGYGKGYYDRFICDYFGVTVGLCYNTNVINKLVIGRFDKPVDILVTDKYIHRHNFRRITHG